MPMVRFDGVDNTLGVASASTYTGTDLTLFIVSRSVSTTAHTYKIASVYGKGPFGTAGDDEATNLNIHADDPNGLAARRVGVVYAGGAAAQSPPGTTSLSNGVSEWAVFMVRFGSIFSRGVVSVRNNLISSSFDVGSTLTDWASTNYTLGSGSIGGSGWPNNTLCDIRAFGIYHRALLDSEVRSLLRYLGAHWELPGIQ